MTDGLVNLDISSDDRLSPKVRIIAATGFGLLVTVFVLAATVTPSPFGYGTHRQLGFGECSVRAWFGKPCPFCGMTTSFSWFVRGEFSKSESANPAGLVLAGVCTGLMIWLGVSAVVGRWWLGRQMLVVWATIAVAEAGFALYLWINRLFAA